MIVADEARLARDRSGSFVLARRLFLRLLAVVYACAFLSLLPQAPALMGPSGLEPAELQLTYLRATFGADAYRLAPTLCWFGASDAWLRALCWGGAALSLLLFLDVAPALVAFALWAGYLSLVTVGGDFLSFQWDVLLLEAGLLAVFFAPWRLGRWAERDCEPSKLARWLLWWLVFRLMFFSGAVKLASGDPTWRDLTALEFHYQTQPLPTVMGWWAHQLPAGFQHFSCGVLLAIELAVPFLIFAPRRARHVGALTLIALQIVILLTGNYGIFNLLSIALCLTLFDDAALARWIPTRWRAQISPQRAPTLAQPIAQAIATGVWAVAVVAVSGVHVANLAMRFDERPRLAGVARSILVAAAPLSSINSYGLFAVMTTERNEIVLEGSNDGRTWLAYEMPWKPGDLSRAPGWVAPHMPRLDWQMWFAALSEARRNAWFGRLVEALLAGSPEVLARFEKNPFPDAPPKQVRASFFRYEFTTRAERRATGAWWKRATIGLYLAPASLK